MLQEFRSLEFHRDYEFVCEELPKLSSERGISGLNDEAQRKVYAVGYFFQLYAILAQLGIIDRRFMGVLLRRRYVEVWNSLRPVVLRERQLRNLPDESILNWLEEFAAYAERLPADEIVRIRVKQHKRSSVRNTALNTRSATTDPALVE
ncbi:hypothetical protein [Catenuloplanes japonicus]|uniref:hypothetical protein n=1 Tax=Catenuloplanes japonicus TaxID=33876 RepID=UPI0018DBE34A|nr:hypothetical protein [Catenuloplanes japonicus]